MKLIRIPLRKGWLLSLASLAVANGFLLPAVAASARAKVAPPDTGLRRAQLSQVLANVKKAMGYDQMRAQKAGFMLEGSSNVAGMESTFTYLLTQDGHFARTITGKLGQQSGFDGKTAWTTDFSGMPRILELRDREEELTGAWILAGRWLEKDGPFSVQLEPTEDPETVSLLLTLKDGMQKERVTISRTTWLPTQLTDVTAQEPETMKLADWRPALGFKFPHQLEQESYGEKQTFTIKKVSPTPTFVRSPYSPLMARPADTTFNAAVPAKVEAKRARTGHMLVHPLVDGQDMGWFILDSGAGAMVISPKVAEQLKMPGFGRMTALGVGGPVKTQFRQGEKMQLGPMTLSKPLYIELDFSQLSPIFGVPIAGLCGYDIFSRAVVTYDIKNGGVELYDPAQFKLDALSGGSRWNELFLNGRIPVVQAAFEGNRKELFTLDTGSNATLTFHAPAVQRLKLLEGRQTTVQRAGGVGGFNDVKYGPIDYFELGGKRFEKPQVQFSEAKSGAFTEPYTTGNIGGGFLEGFRLVFNYPEKKIAFLSNEQK